MEAALGAEVARTVLGGPEVAADFVRQPFDHLLFTGSTERGREVLRAAAEHLTPVTLELGGKCPAVVLPDADLDRGGTGDRHRQGTQRRPDLRRPGHGPGRWPAG